MNRHADPTDRKPMYPMTGEKVFWDLVEPMYADPAVRRSTMMGLPCVRLDGRFFASLDRRTGALLVKLPAARIGELIADGVGEPFAPAGRVFREWVAIAKPDRERWQRLLTEARDHAGQPGPGTSPVKPAGTTTFSGFSAEGLAFLAGLERDNSKRYFDAHRRTYQQQLFEPSKTFVVALGAELRRRLSERLRAEPRVGGSLFRIANDLRFAKDRPPYKPHLDMAFWQGDNNPRTDPSFILRITSTEIHLGAGVFALTGAALDHYRVALSDSALATELDQAVSTLVGAGAELSEPTRTRPPSGFQPAEPAARFAVRDGFYVVQRFPHPEAIGTAQFVSWCADHLAPFQPLHEWLTRWACRAKASHGNAAGGA
jgi:uncharacterized protein (TIGR02453 family)